MVLAYVESKNKIYAIFITTNFLQDADLGDNGRIEYSLKGTEDFKIDLDSGDLFTNAKLDRETTDTYTVSLID